MKLRFALPGSWMLRLMDSLFLEPTDAARILHLSTDRVRQLCDEGVLRAIRTRRGTRLLRREDVERLALERAAQRPQNSVGTSRRSRGAEDLLPRTGVRAL
jgi:excisionase family DNA binding protein